MKLHNDFHLSLIRVDVTHHNLFYGLEWVFIMIYAFVIERFFALSVHLSNSFYYVYLVLLLFFCQISQDSVVKGGIVSDDAPNEPPGINGRALVLFFLIPHLQWCAPHL